MSVAVVWQESELSAEVDSLRMMLASKEVPRSPLLPFRCVQYRMDIGLSLLLGHGATIPVVMPPGYVPGLCPLVMSPGLCPRVMSPGCVLFKS